MANCSAGRPTCKISCSGGGCACVYEHETDACYCECFEPDAPVAGNLKLSAEVSVTINKLPLHRFALRLDRLMARDVFVPASRSRDIINLKLRRVPLSEAVKRLGLVTKPRPKKIKR